MRPEYHESYRDYQWAGAQRARKARDQRARYLVKAGYTVLRTSVRYDVLGSRRPDSTYYLHASRNGAPVRARCDSVSPRSNRPGLPKRE